MREAESASGKNSAAATATDSERMNLGDSTAHKSERVMARGQGTYGEGALYGCRRVVLGGLVGEGAHGERQSHGAVRHDALRQLEVHEVALRNVRQVGGGHVGNAEREHCSREERERGWQVGQGVVVAAGGQRENGREVVIEVEVVVEVGNSAFPRSTWRSQA